MSSLQKEPTMNPESTRGMGRVIALCALAGLITVAVTLAFGHVAAPAQRFAATAGGIGATEEYGRRLISQTTEYLGPDVSDPKMRYMNSRLACASCHIGAGVEPGNLSLATAFNRYPRISPRVGGNETIQDRINGCMMRSMNGRALAQDSPEMAAMVAYLHFLADQDAGTGATGKKPHEPPAFRTPKRAADLKNGEEVFGNRCAACHGKDGAGLAAAKDLVHGFVFPPLWGPNSFNDGAGMHRVLTAAKFVKARMPLGNADLDDDRAFDVAAYFNSRPRPHMEGLARDYPDRAKKPVDTGYGPYADPFTIEQHSFGPFPPIEAFYHAYRK
jgi:thiosulfate dehydrogenase